MTIEIHRPELEALILQRMESGGFRDIEDLLMQALRSLPIGVAQPTKPGDSRTGADLIAALQACPWPDIDITPPRVLITEVREVVL